MTAELFTASLYQVEETLAADEGIAESEGAVPDSAGFGPAGVTESSAQALRE